LTATLAKAARHPEREVKAQLRPALDRHFSYREEVAGVGPKGQKVKIDFLCFPLARVVEQGWPARWFGIEAKGYGLQDQRKKAACRLLYQATIYRMSTFPVGAEQVSPDLVLIFPSFGLMLFDEYQPGVFGDSFQDGYALALAKTGGMHRVGELILEPNLRIQVFGHGLNPWYSTRWGCSRADCFGAEDNHASR